MLEVKVWGDYACFTRPEQKVERMSYDVMTPSAARGVLEAISWKPEFYWKVREIWVLKPIRHFSLVRNEVKSQASETSAKKWQKKGGGYFADQDRTQRYSLILRDVAYIIKADIELAEHATSRGDSREDLLTKYECIFKRRVKNGQAYAQPYLGTREFSAWFCEPCRDETAIDHSDDLGRMLFDMQFAQAKKGAVSYRRHSEAGGKWTTGNARPVFFDARLDKGVLYVPDKYDEVR